MQHQPYQNQYTTENIIKSYSLLSSEDSEQRQRANKFLMSLADHQQTWITCQNMIQHSTDANFIFLGAQLLYQKIEKDLHQFDSGFKSGLKNFLFSQLDSGKHTRTFIIDKLASSAALIVSSMLLSQWVSFVEDLTQFMKKSRNHLLSGLMVLQRIPQQLRMTNRIPQGIKSRIQQSLLKKEQQFAMIFESVLQLNDDECIHGVLKTMQSWIRICFPLMKYPHLVSKVLQNSLKNVDRLQICIKVTCEAVKLVAEQKSPGLSQLDPAKQQQSYSQQQITSLQSIVQYSLSNKKNFLSLVTSQPQYTEIYLQLIQQLLLSFGFLTLQQLGFQLLNIIKQMTQSKDLKLSVSTFQFWTDYSEKISRMKLLNLQVKQKLWGKFVELLDVLCSKLLITNDTLMIDADLKDDDTVDDADGITFAQYRQDAAGLLRSIYDYFVKVNKEKGAQVYFKKVVHLLQNDNPTLTRYTQLGLFLLKSPLQSMINQFQTSHIIQILSYLITQINTNTLNNQPIAPIVLGETMNFIRDCTREIKEKDQLFLQALKFVLNYINDEKLCHHAAYCFQILMETISTLNQPLIAESLIHFYSQKRFTKQVVLEKMLQGIFNAIIKVPDLNKVESYLDSILNTMFKKYNQCSKTISPNQQNRSQLYLSLVEIKTLLDSYDTSNATFKTLYRQKFLQLANKAVQITNQILPLGIKNKLKFSSINEVGLAISIYRVCLKILQVPQAFTFTKQNTPSYIVSLDVTLMILNSQDINQYFYVVTILSETLVQFINHDSLFLNVWLQANLPYFCAFFIGYYQNPQLKTDPDIMKVFFTVQQSLLLYNRNIFDHYQQKQTVLMISLHALRHLNERNMQRKVVSFIYLGLENGIWAVSNFQYIVQNVFASIPIVHSMCYTNLAKIFKHIFKSTTLQSKQKVLFALLGLQPYNQLDQNIKTLLSKTIAMALSTEEERNIKTVFVQLNEIVWKKMSSDIVMQLQLKTATWKRQFKKLQQQQQQQQNNNVTQQL